MDVKKYIQEILRICETIGDTSKVEDFLNNLRGLLEDISNFECFNFQKMKEYAERALVEPLREINIREFEDEIERYLKECKIFRWKEVLNTNELKVYGEPGRRAYFIIYNNISLFISAFENEVSIEKRNIYDFMAELKK